MYRSGDRDYREEAKLWPEGVQEVLTLQVVPYLCSFVFRVKQTRKMENSGSQQSLHVGIARSPLKKHWRPSPPRLTAAEPMGKQPGGRATNVKPQLSIRDCKLACVCIRCKEAHTSTVTFLLTMIPGSKRPEREWPGNGTTHRYFINWAPEWKGKQCRQLPRPPLQPRLNQWFKSKRKLAKSSTGFFSSTQFFLLFLTGFIFSLEVIPVDCAKQAYPDWFTAVKTLSTITQPQKNCSEDSNPFRGNKPIKCWNILSGGCCNVS